MDGSTAINDAEGCKVSSSARASRQSLRFVDGSIDLEGLQPNNPEQDDVQDGNEPQLPFPIAPEPSVADQLVSASSVVSPATGAGGHRSPKEHVSSAILVNFPPSLTSLSQSTHLMSMVF